MNKKEKHLWAAIRPKLKFLAFIPLGLCLMLSTACDWFGANYLLQEGETFVKVVKIKDDHKTRWQHDVLAIYKNSESLYKAFLVHKEAFGYYRYSLTDNTFEKQAGKWFCGGDSYFAESEQTAEIVLLGERGPPYLVVYGSSGGSAGFVDIKLYHLTAESPPPGERVLCADIELAEACYLWADEQPKIVRARWMFAQSIGDILYVLRKVRGE